MQINSTNIAFFLCRHSLYSKTNKVYKHPCILFWRLFNNFDLIYQYNYLIQQPNSGQSSLSITLENVRKLPLFWCIQWYRKSFAIKCVNLVFGNLNQYLPTGLPLNLFVLVGSNTKKCVHFLTHCNVAWIVTNFFFQLKRKKQVTRGFSVKKVLVKISQDSKESTCARVSFLK